MALPMVGGNERLMERPGGANLPSHCWWLLGQGELRQGALLRISGGAGGV